MLFNSFIRVLKIRNQKQRLVLGTILDSLTSQMFWKMCAAPMLQHYTEFLSLAHAFFLEVRLLVSLTLLGQVQITTHVFRRL